MRRISPCLGSNRSNLLRRLRADGDKLLSTCSPASQHLQGGANAEKVSTTRLQGHLCVASGSLASSGEAAGVTVLTRTVSEGKGGVERRREEKTSWFESARSPGARSGLTDAFAVDLRGIRVAAQEPPAGEGSGWAFVMALWGLVHSRLSPVSPARQQPPAQLTWRPGPAVGCVPGSAWSGTDRGSLRCCDTWGDKRETMPPTGAQLHQQITWLGTGQGCRVRGSALPALCARAQPCCSPR